MLQTAAAKSRNRRARRRCAFAFATAANGNVRDVTLGPGAVHLPRFLTLERQRALLDECRALADGVVPAYVPTVRGGGRMHVRMLCLGRHWNGKTYCYERSRTDFDGLPAPPLPASFRALASEIAHAAGTALDADVCILNYYAIEDGRMGLHQDKDENERSLAAGLPVVSVSLGDTARFQFGGVKRRDPVQTIALESGDAFVFGGPARLRYHGVSRILPNTAPRELAFAGRFNLTFRQYDTSSGDAADSRDMKIYS
jgi:alkylated DNA repair protein (DNA oxidative demethylase)